MGPSTRRRRLASAGGALALALGALVLGAAPASAGANPLANAYSQAPAPARGINTLPISNTSSGKLHTDSQARVLNNAYLGLPMINLFQRSLVNGNQYAIDWSYGTDLSSMSARKTVIYPGRNALGPVDGIGCGGVYAPSVIQDPTNSSRISMVFEADPHDTVGGTGTSVCPWEFQGHPGGQYIGMADSTDGGNSWTNFRRIADTNQTGGANLSVPSINYFPKLGKIVLYFNKNPGGNGFQEGHIRTYNTNVPSSIGYSTSASEVALINSQITYNGTALKSSWPQGMGRADIAYAQGPPGSDDGYYYMVFEAWAGTGSCLQSGTGIKEQILIARATSPNGPWAATSNSWAPTNLRTCNGPDMPTWLYDSVNQRYHVISTDNVDGTEAGRRLLVWNLS